MFNKQIFKNAMNLNKSMISRDRIRKVLREEYIGIYVDEGNPVPQFNPNSRIYEDLHADKHPVGKAAALEWRANVAKRFGITDRAFIDVDPNRDYTVSELVTAVHSALSK
jgi:hypothetical protein